MTDPTPLSPASLWHNSTTDRISFNEDSSEIIRIDQQGFHYKGQFIKDAGEAYRLLVEFLRKHQPDQQWGAEHNDTPLSPAALAVLDAYMNNCGWLDGPLDRDYCCVAAVLRAAADQLKFADDYGTRLINADDLLAIATELENHAN